MPSELEKERIKREADEQSLTRPADRPDDEDDESCPPARPLVTASSHGVPEPGDDDFMGPVPLPPEPGSDDFVGPVQQPNANNPSELRPGRQRGDRMNSRDNPLDQLEEIDAAQRRIRQGKSHQAIDPIEKSRQRDRNRLRDIANDPDLLDEYD